MYNDRYVERVLEKAPNFSHFATQIRQILATDVNYHLVNKTVTAIAQNILSGVKDKDVITFLKLPASRKGKIICNSVLETAIRRGLEDALSINGVTCFVLNMKKGVLKEAGIDPIPSFLAKVSKEVPELDGIRNDGEFESDGYYMFMVTYDYKVPFIQTDPLV